MLPSLQTPFGAASLRASVAELLPAEPAPSPAVDVAEALKAGWLELWYQQKINTRSLAPSGAEALGPDAASRLGHRPAGLVHSRRQGSAFPRARPNSWSAAPSRTGATCWRAKARSIFDQSAGVVLRRCRGGARPVPRHAGPPRLWRAPDRNRQRRGDRPSGPCGGRREHVLRLHNIALAIDNVAQLALSPGASKLVVRRTQGRPAIYQRCPNDRLKQTVRRRIVELAQGNGARAVAQAWRPAPTFLPLTTWGSTWSRVICSASRWRCGNLPAPVPQLATRSDKPS